MKLYAPAYYKRFACIADRCRHSCCVGWEIDIDDDTMQIYSAMTQEYGNTIRGSIETTDTPHFRLATDERCPHLNERGLCNIILSCGEQYLCDICREHPRFYNDSPLGREVGLGMACEEACRLILESDDYAEMIEIEELGGEVDADSFDAVTHRDRIYTLLSDESVSYIEKLRAIYGAYDVSPSVMTDEKWQAKLTSLEYLHEEHKPLLAAYSSNLATSKQTEKPLERALAYFIYRHCTEACDEDDLRARLGFCLFCERLLASMLRAANATTTAEMVELARILSEELEYSEDNTRSLTSIFY